MSVTPTDPWFRFLFWIVATAVAIRVSWLLVRPVLPALAVLVVLVVIARLIVWYRGRW